jgi:hypothetical protein
VRQSDGAENFAACGQRRGLLALDLGSIFKKLLHQKTFILLRSATVIKLISVIGQFFIYFFFYNKKSLIFVII